MEYFDPNSTVRGEQGADASMGSNGEPATDEPQFFYKEAGGDENNNDYREEEDLDDMSEESGCKTPENRSPHEANRSGNTGDSIIAKMDMMETPSTPFSAQVQLDLIEVRNAVERVGGLVSQKAPDLDKMKPRIGQELEVINEALDIGEEIFIPERPAEQSLPKLSSRNLLPPSSTAPIPLEYEHGIGDHEYAQERRIEFLVMKKSRTNRTIPAGFLDEKELQQLFDHVRNAIDDIQIMDTVLWTRVDKATTISSMMLCTLNYRLFNEVRHAIRIYQEIEGFRIETYEKAEFVKKYGLTMYVPRDNANLSPTTLIRTLMFKCRELYTKDIVLLSRSTFKTDHPDKPPEARSRIGDRIFLFDSPTLAEKLRPYPEDKKFLLNRGFSVTIKGGHRGNDVIDIFSHAVTSSVIKSAADEPMANAQEAAD